MASIAENVIEKFGDKATVANILGLSVTQIYRFTYPKKKGGTGGLIPAEHQQTLLNEARARGIKLFPSDFFDQHEGAA